MGEWTHVQVSKVTHYIGDLFARGHACSFCNSWRALARAPASNGPDDGGGIIVAGARAFFARLLPPLQTRARALAITFCTKLRVIVDVSQIVKQCVIMRKAINIYYIKIIVDVKLHPRERARAKYPLKLRILQLRAADCAQPSLYTICGQHVTTVSTYGAQ